MLRRISIAAFLCAAIVEAFQTPDPSSATFRAGTRLVELEVVVRSKNGPVTGLTRDDFTVLDEGKLQRIDVFRAGQANRDTAVPAVPLAPGAVSNRVNRIGEALPSATVVLFDQINTRIDLKAYESKQMLKLVRGLGPRDRVAIYALGRNLHVLQDFTDDPGKLLAAVHLDAGRDLMPANIHDALSDFPVDMIGQIEGLAPRATDAATRAMYEGSIRASAENNARVNAANNDWTTVEALQRIVQHLSGMPGRRNLIWMKENPVVPSAVMGMLVQANIALYPVLIRTVIYDAGADLLANNTRQYRSMPDFMATQNAGRALAAVTGGAGFDDAGDLQIAVKTAEEDSQTAYTLGYYPSEDILDGKYHRFAVSVAGEKSAHLEVRYRPGYLATKQEIPTAAPSNDIALTELFQNPLDATALGLTGRFEPDSRPGLYQVRVTLDLHDVRLEREGDRSVGKVEMAIPFGDKLRARTVDINLTDSQLADALKTGFEMPATGIQASGGSIRVVVRDPSTGLAGSLRIPLRVAAP